MKTLRRYLPVTNLVLLAMLGLTLVGGNLLHGILPHHDDDPRHDDALSCSICKLTENAPGALAPEVAVQALIETSIVPPEAPGLTGVTPTASASPRAPPTC